MFKKKKLYKIVYQLRATYATIVEAKDEFQALKKIKKEVRDSNITPTIISFTEYSVK